MAIKTKLSIARELGYDIFTKVMEDGHAPERLFEDAYKNFEGKLSRLDRNFMKEMVYGSLRWYSKIYWIVQNTSKRDLKKSSAEVRTALVLGTYQIFYMDKVPDRAAVNESVEFIREKGQSSASSFVNGILRSIARRAEYFPKPDKDKNPIDYLSLQYAHPSWIVQRWSRHFHFEKMREILSSNNQAPPYTVRINSLKVSTEELPELRSTLLREEKNHSERRALRSCLHLRESPRFDKDSLFQKGYFSVQDESSQLIAHLVNPVEGERIVDACAGKGGKTGHIYELSEGKADIIAFEKNKQQVKLAKENMKRLGHKDITWNVGDFLEYKPRKKPDKILLDSPCSGLGVLRRHPEGKWQKSLILIANLTKVQRALIKHALDILKPGGQLIYSVCSFEKEEVLDHLQWLKEEGEKFELISPVSLLPDYYKKFVTRDNVLLVYSGNKDSMDGFGAFILQKK